MQLRRHYDESARSAQNAWYQADINLDTVVDAHKFHKHFLETAIISPDRGICDVPKTDWAAKILRRSSVPVAVVEKIGSASLCKRRPENTDAFLKYVERQYESQEPILFRIPVGPIKNMNLCGSEQNPDIAEYLMMIQLARMVTAVTPLYPHGIKVQLVPDNLRARKANMCPDEYTNTYINGLHTMNKALGFEGWLIIEDGEQRLYQQYEVESYQDAAEQFIAGWKENDPESFALRWKVAMDSAEKNFPEELVKEQHNAVECSAMRYLQAHQAEILSGMWSTDDAFPLVMANHGGNFQLFTMAQKKTKLPWQIALPQNALSGTEIGNELKPLFAKPDIQAEWDGATLNGGQIMAHTVERRVCGPVSLVNLVFI